MNVLSEKFSVIMPCYNSQEYVEDALNSIINQTYTNWELIAVNDGSSDTTEEILCNAAEKDGRIKVFSKENGGYVSAVNFGLEHITGDYFLLLGSDDRFGVDLFEYLFRCVCDRKPDCISFRTRHVISGEIKEVDGSTDFSEPISVFDTTFAMFDAAYPKYAGILSGRDTSKCYHRRLLGDIRYYGKYGYDADGIFSMLLCHHATSFASIPVDGYYWTLRGDSLSGRKSSLEQDCDRIEIWIRFYSQLQKLPQEEITETELKYLNYFIGIIEKMWSVSSGRADQRELVKKAADIIFRISDYAGYPLSLSIETKMLLHTPVFWKAYMLFPENVRSTLKDIKKHTYW